MNATTEIPQFDDARAQSIIAEAKNHGMYDEDMPATPEDRITLAAKIVGMAQTAKAAADADPSAVANTNAVMAVLYQAEVEGGTPTGASVIPSDLNDETMIPINVMGTDAEWSWKNIKRHVIENRNTNLEMKVPWGTAALDRERANGSGPSDPQERAAQVASHEQIRHAESGEDAPAASGEVEYRVNEDAELAPSAEETWIDTEGEKITIKAVIDTDTFDAVDSEGEECILNRSDLQGRMEKVEPPAPPPAPEPTPEPSAPAAAEEQPLMTDYDVDTSELLAEVKRRGLLDKVSGRKTKKKLRGILETDDAEREAAQAPPPAEAPAQAEAPAAIEAAQQRLQRDREQLHASDTEEFPGDDEQWQVLRTQATNAFFAEKGIPVPPEYEGDLPEMPLDITRVSDQDIRKLMGQFQAVTARAKFKWALTHAFERACKRRADQLVREKMPTVEGGTVTEKKAAAEADGDVVKWRSRENKHHDDAFAYKQLMEIHADDRDVCSREISGRELEVKRG